MSIVTNSCTYLLKNTLKSHKILSPWHVSDHTRIHPQGAIIRSWLKYLQVHGASPYSRYCGCIGELQCENMRPLRRQLSPTCHCERILHDFKVFFNKYVHELVTNDTDFIHAWLNYETARKKPKRIQTLRNVTWLKQEQAAIFVYFCFKYKQSSSVKSLHHMQMVTCMCWRELHEVDCL